MYVDDKGVAKESPRNRRASEICTHCGLSIDVRGDAFIAKVRTNRLSGGVSLPTDCLGRSVSISV